MGFFEKKYSNMEILEKYDVFEGIECNAVLPEKQLKASGKSGATKGLATLAFGFVGLAATSGVSHNEENRDIKTIIQIVDKGIVFKNGSMDGGDLRIPFSEIINVEAMDTRNKYVNTMAIITLLENKRIFVKTKLGKVESDIVMNNIANVINQRAYGIKFEEHGWGLDSQKKEDEDSEIIISDLKCIGNMYEKELLTKEEYSLIKQKIIGNMVVKLNNHCKTCGTELSKDSIFCSECGTKVE